MWGQDICSFLLLLLLNWGPLIPIYGYGFQRLFNEAYVLGLKSTPAVLEMYFTNDSVKTLGKYFFPLQNAVLLNHVATIPKALVLVPFMLILLLPFFFLCSSFFSVNVGFFLLFHHLVNPDLYLNLFSQALVLSFFATVLNLPFCCHQAC